MLDCCTVLGQQQRSRLGVESLLLLLVLAGVGGMRAALHLTTTSRLNLQTKARTWLRNGQRGTKSHDTSTRSRCTCRRETALCLGGTTPRTIAQ